MTKVIKLLATGFGIGNLKPAPGTWGTFLALILAFFIPVSWYFLLITSVLGIYICHRGEEILREHDSPRIVWDEMVGFWIAVYHLPTKYFFLAFLLFRFFDIVKPFPINNLQKLPGGLGIMIDDIIAGVFSRLILLVLLSIF